jgi:hypothetical protein
VFVLLEKNEDGLELDVNAEVLYQVSWYQVVLIFLFMSLYNMFHTWQDLGYINTRYDIFSIDQDGVRMSKFIEKKLDNDRRYEDGRAFYMSTLDEEDLLYCKKILRPPKEQVSITLDS